MPIYIDVDSRRQYLLTVSLRGRLDNDTVAAFDKTMLEVFDSKPRALVFEMSGLKYISSVGIRSLFNVQKAMNFTGSEIRFVGLQPSVQKVFEIVKAVDINSVFANTEELDAYLDSMQKKVMEGNLSAESEA